jgi:hypothetical protein
MTILLKKLQTAYIYTAVVLEVHKLMKNLGIVNQCFRCQTTKTKDIGTLWYAGKNKTRHNMCFVVLCFRCFKRMEPNEHNKTICTILFGIFAIIENVKKNATTRDKTNR